MFVLFVLSFIFVTESVLISVWETVSVINTGDGVPGCLQQTSWSAYQGLFIIRKEITTVTGPLYSNHLFLSQFPLLPSFTGLALEDRNEDLSFEIQNYAHMAAILDLELEIFTCAR